MHLILTKISFYKLAWSYIIVKKITKCFLEWTILLESKLSCYKKILDFKIKNIEYIYICFIYHYCISFVGIKVQNALRKNCLPNLLLLSPRSFKILLKFVEFNILIFWLFQNRQFLAVYTKIVNLFLIPILTKTASWRSSKKSKT